MPTLLETFTAEINKHFFLKEFSFDSNTFRTASGQEFELADHVIALPGVTLLFQLKERSASAPTDERSLQNWFDKKILDVGCRQLADSARFLAEQPSLPVKNQRGHVRDLAGGVTRVIRIIVYMAHSRLPRRARRTMHYVSKRAEFVHIISIQDYQNLCATLALPSDIIAYLDFRQNLFLHAPDCHWPEAQVAAQFIMETEEPLSEETVREVLLRTARDATSFDLSYIFTTVGEKLLPLEEHRRLMPEGAPKTETDYYRVLAEFAMLRRSTMRKLKAQIMWALDQAGKDEPQQPVRLMDVSFELGFVVFPVHKGAFERRLVALENYTTLVKHEFRLKKVIGICISKENEFVDITWMLAEGPWAPDPELDQILRERSPFRPLSMPQGVYRYDFSTPPEETG